ncbi:CGEA protein [Bacillus pseudomycoides]|uniref:CGEA protein n=1 Tax=Bacillus pseudomycoides TaxID=64104 RepID=UPI003D1E35C1
MAACKGIACFLFGIWPPGTIVTITTRSGQIIGPAALVQYFPSPATNCLVILEEENPATPPSTNYIFISCEDIESVSISSDSKSYNLLIDKLDQKDT